MKHSLKTGFSFGLIPRVITTIGLMVGLDSGTYSKIVVIDGVLTIAIADALGIHISEEAENKYTTKEVYFILQQETKAWKVVAEHLVIALIVIILPHYVGDWIGSTFD